MARVSVTAKRFDPYKNFKFRVKWEGRYVAGVSKVSTLKRTNRTSSNRANYDAVTLERGVTHDPDFEKWASKGKGRRKNVMVEVYNDAGKLATSYQIHRCRVSEYQSLPDLDANANAGAIETIKLENEGWERAR
jgi:phage tail-like protein